MLQYIFRPGKTGCGRRSKTSPRRPKWLQVPLRALMASERCLRLRINKASQKPSQPVQAQTSRDPRGSGAADLEATTPTKASPAQARDPSQPSDKQAHPGERTPPRGPETHTAPNKTSQDQGARPRQGRQARQDRKQKHNTNKARQTRASQARQGKEKTSDPAQARQGEPDQGKPTQGRGRATARVRASPS